LKEGNKTSHRLLGLFLLIFVFSMTSFVLWDSKWILKAPHFSLLVAPFEIILGPIFLLYIKALTHKNYSLKKSDYLHFLPFIAVVLYLLPFYIRSADYKIQFNMQSYSSLPLVWFIFSAFSTIYTIIYLLWSMLLIEKHRRTIKKYYSEISKINLQWIQMLFL